MSTIGTLFTSRTGDAILFGAMITFTVVSLEIYRVTRERHAPVARGWTAFLALAFVALVAGGAIAILAVHSVAFLSLSACLTGIAGAGILLDLVFNGSRDEERDEEREARRVAALDL
jgi:hypothetical protein